MGYVVEVESRSLVRTFGGAVSELFFLPDREAVIYGNGLWFECEGADGLIWKTPRLAWDGTKDVRLEGSLLSGNAFDAGAEAWRPFVVDIDTGALEGGAKPP
jgi:hypothetical protein